MSLHPIVMSNVTAALREMGYTPARAVAACRRNYDVVRWFHDDLGADEIANIIDQHERGGLEAELEVVQTGGAA